MIRYEDTRPVKKVTTTRRQIFGELARAASLQTGVPANLLEAVASGESAFDPNAQAGTSSAYGYMQLLKGTAAEVGVNPRNPSENVLGGARYLRKNLNRYNGDVRLALAAYFKGPQFADELKSGNRDWTDPDMTGGTTVAAYVNNVLSKMKPMSNVRYEDTRPVTSKSVEPVQSASIAVSSPDEKPLAHDFPVAKIASEEKPVQPLTVYKGPITEHPRFGEPFKPDKTRPLTIYQPPKEEKPTITAEELFVEATSPETKALWIYASDPQQQQKMFASLSDEERNKVRSEIAKYQADAAGPALALSALKSTPVWHILPKESKSYAEQQIAQNPTASTIGNVLGNIIQTLGVAGPIKTLVTKVPTIAKSPILTNTLSRMITAGAVSGSQQEWTESFKDSLLNTLESAGAGAVSVIPEIKAPAGFWQLAAQPAADILYSVGTGALRGRDADEIIRQAFLDAALGMGFAIRDVSSGKTFRAEQGAQREELAQWMRGLGNKGYEITGNINGPKIAKALGIEFQGVQKIPANLSKKPWMEFKDPITQGNFTVRDPKDAVGKLNNLRETFGIKPDVKSTTKEMPKVPYIEELNQDTRITSPEEIDNALELPTTKTIELPTRKRGILGETGAVGKQEQESIKSQQPQQQSEVSAFDAKYQKNNEEVKKAFAQPFRQVLKKFKNVAGTLIDDSQYTIKSALRGDPSPEAKAALQTANVIKGASGEALMDVNNFDKSVTKNLPHKYEELLNKYLFARRIVEIEDYYRTADPNKTFKHPQGITYNEAKAAVDAIEGSIEDGGIIKAAAQKHDEGWQRLLKLYLDEGLITPDTYRNLSEAYKHYEPRRIIEYLDAPSARRPSKISVGDSGIESLDEGIEKAMLTNWRVNYAEAANRLYARIYKNRAAKALHTMAQNVPDNLVGAQVLNKKARTYSLEDVESITDNLLGLKTSLQTRMQEMPIQQKLRAQKRLDELEDALSELVVKKDLSDIDTEHAIANLQKKALDVQQIQRTSDSGKEYDFYQKNIDQINKRIDYLVKQPPSQKIQDEINSLNRQKKQAQEKIESPITPQQQQSLESRLESVNNKIDMWAQKINEAKEAGLDEVTFEGKQFEDVPNGYEAVNSMVNGEKQAVILPKEMADSWNREGEIHNTLTANILRFLSGSNITRTFATGAGAPEFTITNTIIDSFYSMMRYHQAYSPLLPVAGAQRAKAMKDVWNDAMHEKGLWERYVKNGGSLEGSYLYQYGKFWAHDPTKVVTESKETADQVYRALTFGQAVSERAGRLATFKLLIDKGYSDAEAAAIVRDGLDFSRGGTLIKFLDNIFPYLNPGTQATIGTWRSAKENPKVFTFKVAQMIAAGMMTSYIAAALNKKGDERISDREKVTNINIPLPYDFEDSSGEERTPYLSIRKDQQSRVFFTIGEVLAERAMGSITGKQAYNRVKMAVDDFMPAGVEDFIPPSVKFFVQYKQNKDFWYDDEIWKGREGISPHKEMYPGYTPEALIDLTKMASEAGVEISPARVHQASRAVLPKNVGFSLVGSLYDEVTDGIDKNDKNKINRTMYEKLANSPGIRKVLKVTRQQKYEQDRAVERAESIERTTEGKVKISTEGKSLARINEELEAAEKSLGDMRQDNDNELRRLLKAQKNPMSFINRIRGKHGDREADRLLRRLPEKYRERKKETLFKTPVKSLNITKPY